MIQATCGLYHMSCRTTSLGGAIRRTPMVQTQTETEVQTPVTGLTTAEVLERRERGQGNNARIETSRSYRNIVVHNLLNPINIIMFVIGAVMIVLGKWGDAISSAGLILL